AAFFDPMGSAVHTALSFDLVGEDVLITGAGPIGVMAAAIARHVGARHVVVTDVNDYRLGLARELGASRAINVGETSIDAVMKDLGMTEGFDVGMEMSGNASALRGLLAAMNHGGRVALLGIPTGEVNLDMNHVIFKGLVLKGIYGREMFETWYKMTAMLTSGLDVSPVLTHRFAVEDYSKAFETMRSGRSGKILLEWAWAAARTLVALDRFEAPAHGVEGVAARAHQSGIQATRKRGWTRRPGKAAGPGPTWNPWLA